MHSIWSLRSYAESEFVNVVFLFDRTPVDGILQMQRVGGSILICCHDDTIINTTLHVVGASSQKEIGIFGFSLERNGDAIGIVVPKRRVNDIFSYSRSGKCQTIQPRIKQAVFHFRPQSIILNGSRSFRQTPLSDTLFGNLQRRIW